MKILFLSCMDILGKMNKGGIVVGRRNYDMLCSLYGNENIDIVLPKYESIDSRTDEIYLDIDISCKKRIMKVIRAKKYCEKYSNKSYKKIFKLINANKYDFLWVDGSSYAGKLIEHIHKNSNIKICLFLHNIETNLYKQSCKKYQVWKYPIAYWIKYNEKLSIENANFIVSLNKRDDTELQTKFHRKSDLIFPVTVEDKFQYDLKKKKDNEKYFLFVGSYFFPNVEGVRWLKKYVMPFVDCKIIIVGKGMEKLKEELEQCKRIEVKGTVDNINDYYVNAVAVVEPIFSGSGMKVKTAEAMMFGKNIIASKEALTGYGVSDIHGIIQCENAEEFIKAMNEMKNENEIYNPQIRELYIEKYSTDKYFPLIRDMLESEKIYE